jgi:hypothetical protein
MSAYIKQVFKRTGEDGQAFFYQKDLVFGAFGE